ncbi:MAG: hypothetical protein K6B28_09790 [Lachnospiraceae bacterium]|nr:hypothetical protein [Lachnospiraceae bacterium]
MLKDNKNKIYKDNDNSKDDKLNKDRKNVMELSDDDLESISGGMTIGRVPPEGIGK